MALSQRIGARVLFGSQATEADVERVAAALAVTAADFQERVDSIPASSPPSGCRRLGPPGAAGPWPTSTGSPTA